MLQDNTETTLLATGAPVSTCVVSFQRRLEAPVSVTKTNDTEFVCYKAYNINLSI